MLELKKDILAVLKHKNDFMTMKEVGAELGVKTTELKGAFTQLSKAGQIQNENGNWIYSGPVKVEANSKASVTLESQIEALEINTSPKVSIKDVELKVKLLRKFGGFMSNDIRKLLDEMIADYRKFSAATK